MVEVNLGRDKYFTKIQYKKHTFHADEPADLGGTDKAADPYTLLLGSLGACSAITIRMYADRKEWDLESIEIHLEMKVTKDENKNTITQINRKIRFQGDLDEKQHQRLLKIADTCPVARVLEGNVGILTEGD
ncbi:MAG: OsmC family protein [Saprospiraceae bacterium]